MRLCRASVVWRQDEGAGGGHGWAVSISKEGDGGPGGEGEVRCHGVAVALREHEARGVAKGAGRHGALMLRVDLSRNLFALLIPSSHHARLCWWGARSDDHAAGPGPGSGARR